LTENSRPLIAFTRFTPFTVTGNVTLYNWKKVKIETPPVFTLCRCGQTKNKPFCDGNHIDTGLNEVREPASKPGHFKAYRGKEVTIWYNNSICSHDGSCLMLLPEVFNKERRPWILPDNSTPEKIIEIIRLCPSGALWCEVSGQPVIDFDRPPEITVTRHGPLEIKGGVILEDDQNSVPASKEHYVLCRCGKSKIKPFCDGEHLAWFLERKTQIQQREKEKGSSE
jgi:CDGSH-type Zn-finger protein